MKSNRLKKFLSVVIMNNLGYKILSAVIAIVVWLIVINIADPVTTRTFSGLHVEVLNQSAITSINQVYEIVEGQNVDFVVKGKASVIRNLKISDFSAYADLAQLSPVYATDIVVKCDRNENIEIDTKNKMMVVKLEDIDTKNVQVVVETSGNVAEGYNVGDYEVKPNMITVTGGISKISQIDTLKVSVNVDGAKKSFSDKVEPVAYDKDGKAIDSSYFTFSNSGTKISEVGVNITIFRTKTIPVNVKVDGKPGEGYVYNGNYEYTPESIVVSGPNKATRNFDHLEIPVDITDAEGEYETNIPLSNYLPEGVETVNSEENISVRVILEKLSTKQITLGIEDIDIRNVPNGYEAVVKDSLATYNIIVEGVEKNLADIDADTVKAFVNLKNAGEGECRVQIQFDGINAGMIKSDPQIVAMVLSNTADVGEYPGATAGPDTDVGADTETDTDTDADMDVDTDTE